VNEQELLLLLEAAQQHLREGKPMIAVNENIARITKGKFPGFMSLQLAIPEDLLRESGDVGLRGVAAEREEEETLETFAEVSPLRNFGEAVLQGLSFGFADDVLGEDFRERNEARRELNPKATLAAEGIGLLAPGLGTGKLAAKVGGGLIRRVGALGGLGAAESGVLAAGEADVATGEASPGARAKRAAGGAALGFGFGAAIPVAGGVTNFFRRNKTLARLSAQELVENTGKSADELFDEVRRLGATDAPSPIVLADADPALARQAPSVAQNAGPAMRRRGGPLEALRARVTSKELDTAQRAVYEPFNGRVVKDKALLNVLKSGDDEMRDAVRAVVPGIPEAIEAVRFEQLQSVRNQLKRQYKSALNQGDVVGMNRITQIRTNFEQQMERSIPGYLRANDQYVELLTRQEGAQRLIDAIDKALPRFNPEIPRGGGIFSMAYKAIGQPDKRRRTISLMVGEAILGEGEEGIKRMETLLRGGAFSRMWRESKPLVTGGLLQLPGQATVER